MARAGTLSLQLLALATEAIERDAKSGAWDAHNLSMVLSAASKSLLLDARLVSAVAACDVTYPPVDAAMALVALGNGGARASSSTLALQLVQVMDPVSSCSDVWGQPYWFPPVV